MSREVCCVADQDCLAAANFEVVPARIGECYRCGQPVCSECSRRVVYLHFGRRRLCNNCLDEIDKPTTIEVRYGWRKFERKDERWAKD